MVFSSRRVLSAVLLFCFCPVFFVYFSSLFVRQKFASKKITDKASPLNWVLVNAMHNSNLSWDVFDNRVQPVLELGYFLGQKSS